MGYECRDNPQGAIQSLLTYSGSIRILNMSSTPIGRCLSRPKLVVDVVGACMDTIFSRQNYRGVFFVFGGALCVAFFRAPRLFPFSSFSHSNAVFFFYSTHYPTDAQIILPHPRLCVVRTYVDYK